MLLSKSGCVSRLCVISLLALAVLSTATSTSAESIDQETEFAVYEGPGCDGAARIPAFEHFIGRKVDRVIDFLDQRTWAIMQQSAVWALSCWKAVPAALTLSIPMLPNDKASSLREGASGAYDVYFRDLAVTLVSSGRADAVLRIGWEFNAKWFPWTATKSDREYIAYWRRIVSTMRSVDGQRFQFEWCFGLSDELSDPSSAYPGDDVVDIISADVYNQFWPRWMNDPVRHWSLLVEQKFGLRWHRDFAVKHNKRIAFPEWGTGTRADGRGAGDDPVFILGMAAWIRDTKPLYQGYWDTSASDFDGEISRGRMPKSAAAYLLSFAHPK